VRIGKKGRAGEVLRGWSSKQGKGGGVSEKGGPIGVTPPKKERIDAGTAKKGNSPAHAELVKNPPFHPKEDRGGGGHPNAATHQEKRKGEEDAERDAGPCAKRKGDGGRRREAVQHPDKS